jgi:WD40 repeat protein
MSHWVRVDTEKDAVTSGDETPGEACVWALLALADGTLVSGDAKGNVQFWDGRFGTLTQGFRRHGAAVLALAASPAGDAVFASGVDNSIALFGRVVDADTGGRSALARGFRI